MTKQKIKEAQEYILVVWDMIDPSGSNRKILEDRFKSMSDAEFITLAKSKAWRIYCIAGKLEPKIDDLVKCADKIKMPISERCTLPFQWRDEDGDAIVSDKKMMILRLNVRRLQQFVSGENMSTSDLDSRDASGQVIGKSKAAMLSDLEVASLVAKGYDKTITEMMTFRADHTLAKEEAYGNIVKTGSTEIPSSVHDPASKSATNMLSSMYLSMGVSTDLIEDLTDL
ncbi:MAG: hypothetical protein ACRCZ9_12125 [Fusobacteriaceae bacterium]